MEEDWVRSAVIELEQRYKGLDSVFILDTLKQSDFDLEVCSLWLESVHKVERRQPKFQEIMDHQLAVDLSYDNSHVKEEFNTSHVYQHLGKYGTFSLSSKMKVEHLVKAFPTVPIDVIVSVFLECQQNVLVTSNALSCLFYAAPSIDSPRKPQTSSKKKLPSAVSDLRPFIRKFPLFPPSSVSPDSLREKAHHLRHDRKLLVSKINELPRNVSLGAQKAEIGRKMKQIDDQVGKLLLEACCRIFHSNNPALKRGDLSTIDLHYLYEEEAVSVLKLLVPICKERGQGQMKIVTGIGNRSSIAPRLRSRVRKYAEDKGYVFVESNPGAFLFSFV